jgi:CRISPR-associated protein Csm3
MALIRYTFTGTLLVEGALHIGSGAGGRIGLDDSLTDATVIRDSRGRPYVPGSSLRGVLRSAIGQLGPSIIGKNGTIRDDQEIEQAVKVQNIAADATEQDQQAMLNKVLHPAERLFGTVYWASPLLIPDLPLVQNEVRSEIRHGVGIDRDTGAAHDGAKYDFEVLPRETAFAFWMRCDMHEEAKKDWSALLAMALRLLEQGELSLGGRIARGVGQVRLQGLHVYELALGGQSLLKALLAEEGAARYGDEQPGWIKQRLEELRNV